VIGVVSPRQTQGEHRAAADFSPAVLRETLERAGVVTPQHVLYKGRCISILQVFCVETQQMGHPGLVGHERRLLK
jgi:hypothetical protein